MTMPASPISPDPLDIAHARTLDAADPLRAFRDRFYIPADTVYLDGNSLGLLSIDAERAVQDALQSWKVLGIDGWLSAEPPWFTLGEQLGARMASLMGATPEAVVVTGSITVNLHQLVGTFYRPNGKRRRIVATALDFPSDVYALQGQIRLRGGDPDDDLMLVPSRDGRTIDEEDIEATFTDEVALAWLPSVLYRSGQLLDVARLTRSAHAAGIVIGVDCAHSAGALPHHLDAWGVDIATWCTYKYLNAGPGAVGALYVNPRHFGTVPALPGWWGYRKERQFDMVHDWEGAPHAGAYQVSTIPLLSAASLLGSLAIFDEAGIDAIREKSLRQTDYLISLVEGMGLDREPYGYRIGTPREHARRGGHVAIEHPQGAMISRALRERGFVVDFRPPNVVRLAPVALSTSYEEVWRAAQALKGAIDVGAHLEAAAPGLVT
jgi:kynureninase